MIFTGDGERESINLPAHLPKFFGGGERYTYGPTHSASVWLN